MTRELVATHISRLPCPVFAGLAVAIVVLAAAIWSAA